MGSWPCDHPFPYQQWKKEVVFTTDHLATVSVTAAKARKFLRRFSGLTYRVCRGEWTYNGCYIVSSINSSFITASGFPTSLLWPNMRDGADSIVFWTSPETSDSSPYHFIIDSWVIFLCSHHSDLLSFQASTSTSESFTGSAFASAFGAALGFTSAFAVATALGFEALQLAKIGKNKTFDMSLICCWSSMCLVWWQFGSPKRHQFFFSRSIPRCFWFCFWFLTCLGDENNSNLRREANSKHLGPSKVSSSQLTTNPGMRGT